MLNEQQAEMLHKQATRAARTRNDPDDCYTYIIEKTLPLITNETEEYYIFYLCKRHAQNWQVHIDLIENHINSEFESCDLPTPYDDTPEAITIQHEEENLIAQLFKQANLKQFEQEQIIYRLFGYINPQQQADFLNENKNKIQRALRKAQKKLKPLLIEKAISEGYNPEGHYIARMGNYVLKGSRVLGDYQPRKKTASPKRKH